MNRLKLANKSVAITPPPGNQTPRAKARAPLLHGAILTNGFLSFPR